ncbi:MAG: tol-pal system protein YbgF [Syntrophorhabdales bacterium]|jgi:tol-pal system protein YbgF
MRFLPLLLIALFAFGCASSGEVSQVKEDVSSVYNDMQKNDARLDRIEKDVKDLQKTIGSPDAGMRKQMVDQSVAGENRDEKIKAILGRLDELESQLRTYWDETKGELRDMKKGNQTGSLSGVPAKGTPEDMYRQGFDAFQRGAYDDAVSTFTQFVQQNPTAPLAPNAYFWMGESYMNTKAHEKAIVQFQEVIDKFPKSDKAARAMLRQAEAFAALNDKKSSTTALKRVIELFPKTEEARVAERMLRSGTLK